MSNRDEVLGLICEEVLASPDLDDLDWDLLALVFEVGEGDVDNGGFVWSGGEVGALVCDSDAIDDYLEQLREAIQVEGEAPFVAMLLQIRASDGALAAEFEYDDPARWRVTADNVDQMHAMLKSAFDEGA